ncbi:MAG: N-acetyltransferase [Pyrinomonadaceae bacterium]|nr:N-acetyltransferase [Pyrinomonadaceae bacterium]
MDIHRTDNGRKGKFFIEKDGEEAAEMTYTMAGDTRMIIDHTGVEYVLRGTGAGKRLVEAGVEYARENSLTVLPLCPFAKAIIDKTPEFQDVLK